MNMIKNSTNSTKKIPPLYWLLTVVMMAVLIAGGILFNQHQKRQTELQLAQLALEQSKVQNQSATTQAASEPVESGFTGIESMVENPESESAHSQAEDEVVAGAIAAVDQAKAQDTSLGNLSSEVDGEYHEGKTLSSSFKQPVQPFTQIQQGDQVRFSFTHARDTYVISDISKMSMTSMKN